MWTSVSTRLYAGLRPPAPPLKAAPRDHAVDDEVASPRRAVCLVGHKALARADGQPVEGEGVYDSKAIAHIAQLAAAHLPQAGPCAEERAPHPRRHRPLHRTRTLV